MRVLIWTIMTVSASASLGADERAPAPALSWPASAPIAPSSPRHPDGAQRLARRRQSMVIIKPIGYERFGWSPPMGLARRALEEGAGGWSFPLRAGADGALVVADFDRLEDCLDGYGALSDATWPELCLYRYRDLTTGRLRENRPVFAGEIIEAALATGACLVPEPLGPGAVSSLTNLLADWTAFPYLVFTPSGDPDLLSDPRYQPLAWKALLTDPRDAIDRTRVARNLSGPGQMVWTPLPRLVAEVSGLPVPGNGQAVWPEGKHPRLSVVDRSRALLVLREGVDGDLDPLAACKRAAAILLTGWPEESEVLLAELLRDPNTKLAARAAAVWGIGLRDWRQNAAPAPDEETATLLLTAAAADWPLGPEALLALGRMGEERVLEPALAALQGSGDAPTERPGREMLRRQAAAAALGLVGMKTEVIVGALTEALQTPSLQHDAKLSGLDAAAAARALGDIAAERSIDALVRAATVVDPAVTTFWNAQPVASRPPSAGAHVRRIAREAILALGRIGGPAASAALDGILVRASVEQAGISPETAIESRLAWATRARLAGPDAGRAAIGLLGHSSGLVKLVALAILTDPARGELLEDAARQARQRLEAGSPEGLTLLIRACLWAGNNGPEARAFLDAVRRIRPPSFIRELEAVKSASSRSSTPDARSHTSEVRR